MTRHKRADTYRTLRRRGAVRPKRVSTPHTGVTCRTCGHYARMIESQGVIQIICNANGAHKG